MSKTTVTTNGRGNKILCTETEVALQSLPRCLRHYGKSTPLEDAIKLTKMLDILFMTFEDNDWTDGKEAVKGVALITALLLDKLEIASGEYQFPLFTHNREAPYLVEREEEE